MTWVRTVDDTEATEALKDRYAADLEKFGFVLEVTKSMSARPDLTLAYDAFTRAIWGTGGLSVRERRLIHLLVAERLRSTYCALFYAAALGHDLGGPEGIRAVVTDYHRAGLSGREIAILEYAEAVAGGHASEAHVVRLRDVGLDDAVIVDVAVTAAVRLFGCRVLDALGVEPDPFFREEPDLVAAITPKGS